RGIRQVAFRVPPATPAADDDFLLRADRHPNSHGAEIIGLDGDAAAILARCRAGSIKVLWVIGHDITAAGWPARDVADALEHGGSHIYTGIKDNRKKGLATMVQTITVWGGRIR